MTKEQLIFIKNTQREFKERFDRCLIVDFPAMAAMEGDSIPLSQYNSRKYRKENVDKYIKICEEKYNLTMQEIIDCSRRMYEKGNTYELFLRDLCTYVLENKARCAIQYCASLLKRDRTIIYYYANKDSKWKKRQMARSSRKKKASQRPENV